MTPIILTLETGMMNFPLTEMGEDISVKGGNLGRRFGFGPKFEVC